MKLFTLALLFSVIALAGCSSSTDSASSSANPNTTENPDNGNNPEIVVDPAEDDPTLGSISIGVNNGPALAPLPLIEFDGTSGSTGGDESILDVPDASPVFDDGAASTESSASTAEGGDTGGSTDGGAGTGGSTTIDGEVSRGDSVATSADASVSSDTDVYLPMSGSLPPEQFQAGTLTAADYDDQLNPHLYQRYASDYLQRVGGRLDVPYIDLSKRIALNVRDSSGNNYSGVQLTFTDGNNELLTLTTPASGTTYLYSDIDRLPDTFIIRATGLYGTAIDQSISLSDAQVSGVINISMPEDQAPAMSTQEATLLDVMFVVDTTGSMGDELNYLQTELTPIINAIPYERSLLNVGLTFYRDIGDEYVVRSHGFTNDISRAQQTLNNESYDGGGDYPEAMDQALHQAIDANWQPNSKRILFLIADAPPHADKMRATWNAAEQARLKNIHIVPIAASGVGEDAEYLMRSIAAYTNSRYLFLTDDSGFGNPHAEPDVDCYVVTHLDNLMIRVMNSLINGERDEPTDNDIIRRVGQYDRGVCATAQTGQ